MKPKTETDRQEADSLQAVVRRFVVQERYAEQTERDWYDDPDIRESVTLEDARKRLEKDLIESRGHGDAFLHRIIERTERVVQSPNDLAHSQKGRERGPTITQD